MLSVTLDKINGIAILRPDGELSENDFISAAKRIDTYLEDVESLNGLVIQAESFPGWDSFSAFLAHMKFIREHHKQISHVALVTDSPFGSLGEHVANHFVSAEIKSFAFNELAQAIEWINEGE